MASHDDADDLYADLYAGDGSGGGDVVDLGGGDAGRDDGADDQDLIGYEDEQPHNGIAADDANTTSGGPASANDSGRSGVGSFIPPPTAAAPTDSIGTRIKGSFIPPANSNDSRSGTDARDLTPHASNKNDNGSSGITSNDYSNSAEKAADHMQHSTQTHQSDRPVMPHEMPEEGKMFVGGLNWDTTEDSLRRYFSQFGEVGNCTIMRDNVTGRSRGFAFLNFVDPKAVNTVMVREHHLDGKVIDPKRAIPRPQQGQQHQHNRHNDNAMAGQGVRNQKLFVGGLPHTVTAESFRSFFEQYGALAECTCMMDKETGKPRGFGFLTYQDDSSVEYLLSNTPVVFDGKEVDIKRAQSKNDPQALQMRRQQRQENPDMAYNSNAAGYMSNNRYGGAGGAGGAGSNNNFNNSNNAGWAGMMNPMMMGMMGSGAGGFDPNAMAQMYQNMGWSGQNWNPQMAWQQMMASMAGGGAGAGSGGASGAGGSGGAMDMSSMMGMGMPNMGMGLMGGMAGMGNMGGAMSPPMGMGGSSQRGGSTGPVDDSRDRAGSSGPRSGNASGGASSNLGSSSRHQRSGLPSRPTGDDYREGSRDSRERSPRASGGDRGGSAGSGYRRERSPQGRRDDRRYDNAGSSRNRY